MVPNFATVTQNSPPFLRPAILSPVLICRASLHRPTRATLPAETNLSQTAGLQSRTLSSQTFPIAPKFFLTNSNKGLSGLKFGFRNQGMDYVRVSAEPSGGSGVIGGSGAGGGGGGGGEDGYGGEGTEGDGEKNSNGSILSWYLDLLTRFPVMTKAVTSALLTLIGDLICQFAVDKVQTLDLKRTFLFTLLGLVLVGPTLHFWYLFLSKLVTQPGASGALMRLVLDQFIFSPIFIGVFLSALVTLEGRPSSVIPKLQQEWWSSVLVNWQLWIPFQFLNFRFVPQQFQVLASNFVALIWNVILSYKAHKEVVAPK